jgi:hypothetical protein
VWLEGVRGFKEEAAMLSWEMARPTCRVPLSQIWRGNFYTTRVGLFDGLSLA